MDDKTRELQMENAYLKGIIVGMQMMSREKQNANEYIPNLAFPQSSAETAQVPTVEKVSQVETLSVAAPQAPTVETDIAAELSMAKGYYYDGPGGAMQYEPPRKPRTAEQMYPWPEWTYAELDAEHKSRYDRLHARKKGDGPIMRDLDGRVEKLCIGCLEFKPIDGGWHKNHATPDGLNTYCITCSRKLDVVYRNRKRYRAGLPDPVPSLRASRIQKKHKPQVDTYLCASCNIEKSYTQFEMVRFSDGFKSRSAVCNECKEMQDKKALQEVMKANARVHPRHYIEYKGEFVQKRLDPQRDKDADASSKNGANLALSGSGAGSPLSW